MKEAMKELMQLRMFITSMTFLLLLGNNIYKTVSRSDCELQHKLIIQFTEQSVSYWLTDDRTRTTKVYWLAANSNVPVN